MDESEKKCWVTQVKDVLSKNGLYSVCAIQRNCVFCVNAIENEEHLFAYPLYNDIREKHLNDTSQNTVTASLENVLSWKSKTNMFRLANKYVSIGQVCFQRD